MKLKFTFLIFLLLGFTLFASEDLLDSDDLDSFFSVEEEVQDEPVVEDSNILKDVVNSVGFDFGADYQVFGGYSPGAQEFETYEDSVLLGMTSSFSLDAQISSDFSVFQKWSANYPNFELTLSQFYAESVIKDRAFLRLGRENITWGDAKVFKLSNILSRTPEDFSGSTDSYSVRLNMPIGLGGINILALTREGMWREDTPKPEEIGVGALYNHIINLERLSLDLNIGTYYHRDMNFRGFFSGTTTIFNIELYCELIGAYNIYGTDYIDDNDLLDSSEYDSLNAEPEFIDNKLDLSANIGFYTDFLDGKVEVGGEYLYCGEETELPANIYKGHNYSLFLKGKLDFINVELSTYFKTHLSDDDDDSYALSPVAIWDINDNLMLSVASPIIWGEEESQFIMNNSDPLDREWSLIIRLIFHGDL